MKKFTLLALFVVLGFVAKADQLAWITLDQAKTAVKYLSKEKKVILWCACCDNDKKVVVAVSKVSYKKAEGDYYQVVLEGINSKGESIVEEIDLAYVHVNIKGKGNCLGQVLKFDCDPCMKPFAWKE